MLKKPLFEHRFEIEKAIEQSLSGLDLLLDGDMERATMKINARPPRPKPDKPVAASAGRSADKSEVDADGADGAADITRIDTP